MLAIVILMCRHKIFIFAFKFPAVFCVHANHFIPCTDILTGDPQLAEEIEFDLRRFEEEQKRLRIPASIIGTPLGQVI